MPGEHRVHRAPPPPPESRAAPDPGRACRAPPLEALLEQRHSPPRLVSVLPPQVAVSPPAPAFSSRYRCEVRVFHPPWVSPIRQSKDDTMHCVIGGYRHLIVGGRDK